jgi:hypothetical protein
MKAYRSLSKLFKDQPLDTVFAHFYPLNGDYDQPFKIIAQNSWEGAAAWAFQQQRFKEKHAYTTVPKLRNYLNYTFVRAVELEQTHPGQFFKSARNGEWICFNTGLQTPHGSDLIATFQRYRQKPGAAPKVLPDWVYKGCYAPNDRNYRDVFGDEFPDIVWYSTDSRDFVFDTSYRLDKDSFDHLFERAKERAGLQHAPDEVVRNYLRGALENLVPKIKRSYKIAIPVYYVEEKRMQMLLPFHSANNLNDISCFVVDRDDTGKAYRLKTIYDLDQAFFSARLLTRPDKEWLNP